MYIYILYVHVGICLPLSICFCKKNPGISQSPSVPPNLAIAQGPISGSFVMSGPSILDNGSLQSPNQLGFAQSNNQSTIKEEKHVLCQLHPHRTHVFDA